MTRDEQRAKCIEAMAEAATISVRRATAAFDAIHGIARVNQIEATEEMVQAGAAGIYGAGWNGPPEKMPGEKMKDVWRKYARDAYGPMCAVGDLTNPPEKKS